MDSDQTLKLLKTRLEDIRKETNPANNILKEVIKTRHDYLMSRLDAAVNLCDECLKHRASKPEKTTTST